MIQTTIKRSIITDFELLKHSNLKLLLINNKDPNYIIVKEITYKYEKGDSFYYYLIAQIYFGNTLLYIPDKESLELLNSFFDKGDDNLFNSVGVYCKRKIGNDSVIGRFDKELAKVELEFNEIKNRFDYLTTLKDKINSII